MEQTDGRNIKVYVNEKELLFLEFVVRRFRADNEQMRNDKRQRAHNPKHDEHCNINADLCDQLLLEFSQAGT